MTQERVQSVDTLRGLTILLMVFVNDLGGAAPSWMHHIKPSNADGMTLADVVFPTFLFIAGVSIPLAFAKALEQGKSRWALLGHVATRTLALLAMGLVELNAGDDVTLKSPWWGLLAFISIILAWCYVPAERGLRRTMMLSLRLVGFAGIIALWAIYRREPVSTDVAFLGHVENWTWLRTEWWGILGLIGWAYLTVSLVYLVVGPRREWLMGAIGILLLLNLSAKVDGVMAHVDDKAWLGGLKPVIDTVASWFAVVNDYVDFETTLGSLPAITMAGCLLGTILTPSSDVSTHRDRLRWGLTFTGGLLLAAVLTDCFGGINKIAATPAWCLLCSAIACSVWAALYLVMDVWQFRRWSIVVRPAGANPLIAYLLHPILVWVISLAGIGGTLLAYQDSRQPWVAILGSIVMALVVCGLTGLISKLGLRMRV